MNPAPLPMEFITGLPPAIAPTLPQVAEMFPAMVPIKLGEACVSDLNKLKELSNMAKSTSDIPDQTIDLVVGKFGGQIDKVCTNPLLAVSSVDEWRAVMTVKRVMETDKMARMMESMVISKLFHQLRFSRMCDDLMSRYPDMRFDVDDYISFIYKKTTQEVMIFEYSIPDYRFATARPVVKYSPKLSVVSDHRETPEHDIAERWAHNE